jgi:thioredoxin reductase
MGVYYYTPLTARDDVRTGEPVVIVAGGNSAGQAAISLASRGHHVTMVVRDGIEDIASRARFGRAPAEQRPG